MLARKFAPTFISFTQIDFTLNFLFTDYHSSEVKWFDDIQWNVRAILPVNRIFRYKNNNYCIFTLNLII